MISAEIKSVKELVKRLLIEIPACRESDEKLVCHIWKIQAGGRDKLQEISAYDFLKSYAAADSIYYTQESIGRARRKIQELHPELRGNNYKERQAHEEKVIEEVKREI